MSTPRRTPPESLRLQAWLLASFPGSNMIAPAELTKLLIGLFEANGVNIELREHKRLLTLHMEMIVLTHPITPLINDLLQSVEAALGTIRNRLDWSVGYAIVYGDEHMKLRGAGGVPIEQIINATNIDVYGTAVPQLVIDHCSGWVAVAPLSPDKGNVFSVRRPGENTLYIAKLAGYESLHASNQANEIQDHLANHDLAPRIIETRNKDGIGLNISEKMEGTLADILEGSPNNEVRSRLASDIKKLVKQIHILDIYHGDLHLSNIVYSRVTATSWYKFKLIDFEMSFYISKENIKSVTGDEMHIQQLRDIGPTDDPYANYINEEYQFISDEFG